MHGSQASAKNAEHDKGEFDHELAQEMTCAEHWQAVARRFRDNSPCANSSSASRESSFTGEQPGCVCSFVLETQRCREQGGSLTSIRAARDRLLA